MNLLRRLFGYGLPVRFCFGDDDGDAAHGTDHPDPAADGGKVVGAEDAAGDAGGDGDGAGAGLSGGADQEGEQGVDGVDMAGKLPAVDPNAPKTMLEAMFDGDGKVKGTEVADPAAAAAEKPAAQIKPKAGEQPDPLADKDKDKKKPPAELENALYKMPEGLGPQARERFKVITEGHKAMATELETVKTEAASLKEINDQVVTQRDGFREMLAATDTSPDDLNGLFTYKEHLKNKNWTGARAILEGQLRQLSLMSGEEYGAVDPLDDYPELKEEVDNHEMSRARALEIVRGRQGEKVTQDAAARRQADETAEAARVEMTKGEVAKIANWGKQMAGRDIDYAAKQAKLLAKIPDIMKKYPPNQWLQATQDAYDSIVLPAKAAPPNPGNNGGNRPLRPSGGGGTPAAATMQEHWERGLGYVRG